MNNIDDPISRIESAFGDARHIGWDFAAEGDWQYSKKFLFDERKHSDEVFSWLHKCRTSDIACEALFQLESGVGFFLGVGTHHLTKNERKRVIGEFLAMPRDGRSLVETAKSIQNVLGSDLPLNKRPDCLVLGVGGLWKNVGALLVWRKDGSETILPFKEIEKDAPAPERGRSPLHEPQPNNIMLEAVISTEGTFECWLAFPVSTFDEGPPPRHTLCKKAYYAVANILSPGV